MGKNIKMENGPIRKRGRPSGKNRTPLSTEERRARNAQYERERRAEYADAMAELAAAMGFDPKVQSYELLDAGVNYIQTDRESVDSLKEINRKLKMQIRTLKQRTNPVPAEQPSPVPDVDPLAFMSCPDDLTSGIGHAEMYGAINGTMVVSGLPGPASTEGNAQTDDMELDFDFLLDYLETQN